MSKGHWALGIHSGQRSAASSQLKAQSSRAAELSWELGIHSKRNLGNAVAPKTNSL
ncbi:MAG: hypothetical protein F6J93_38325 [Oscillatoria sp. SIO1A7]|nr:hypothetical protein [Oscillatoria sp. SIO1A7]